MEELSGLRQEDVFGNVCLREYMITNVSNHQEQLVKLSRANGNKIEVKKLFEL